MRRLRLGLVGACGLVLVWSAAWAWQTTITGTLSSFELAQAVAVDGSDDVVAAGWTEHTGSGRDFTVVKLDGAGGAERWRYVLNGTLSSFDVALAVVVDGAGDVVAAGLTQNTGSGEDFTVVKLRGSDGEDIKVPFAAFTVTVEIKGEAFEVKGPFTLGEASDGIEPFKEEVSVQIGPFALTIPASAFAEDGEDGFRFEGTIDGIALEVTIALQGDDTFEFKAEGTGADLSGIENPVPVTLPIGDDHGATTVVADIE
jgi:hypothetical protein